MTSDWLLIGAIVAGNEPRHVSANVVDPVALGRIADALERIAKALERAEPR